MMVSPSKWQQHDLWPALNLKGGCGQGFFFFYYFFHFKAGKMSNRRKKALQNPWYKKKIWLLTVMFWGHACLPRQSMWLWADGHPFPLNRTTIMGICPTKSEQNYSTQTDLPQLSLPCQVNDIMSCFMAESSQVDQMMYERQHNPLK